MRISIQKGIRRGFNLVGVWKLWMGGRRSDGGKMRGENELQRGGFICGKIEGNVLDLISDVYTPNS